MRPIRWTAALACALCLGSSCARIDTHVGNKSPLVAARPERGTVSLEMYWIRFPFADPELNGPMWDAVDEHALPVETRRRLEANGLRVGLLGSQLPLELTRLLEEEETSAPRAAAPTDTLQAHALDVTQEPKVLRSLRQIPSGGRTEVITAGAQERVSKLVALVIDDQGELSGGSYEQASTVLSIRPTTERDGRVRLEIVPRIDHGAPRNRHVPLTSAEGPAMFRVDVRPDSRTFDELAVSPSLSGGQLLLIGCRPEREGSVGCRFFTDHRPGEPLVQKLLVVRVLDRPQSELFADASIPDAQSP